VLYESHRLAALAPEAVGTLLELAYTLGLTCEAGDMDTLQHWLQAAANGTRAETPTAAGSSITAFFDNVYAGVTQRTGGWGELRMLLPLTLAFLGFRSLLLTENLPFPTWYDYLWFAFGTFAVLNAPGVTREKPTA
jgi:hypothetical protein